MKKSDENDIIHGFSKLSYEERMEFLLESNHINHDDYLILNTNTALDRPTIEQFIENSIGSLPIPLGIAINFMIDNKKYIIPMAIEETSVIASASKNAKWIHEHGILTTEMIGKLGLGQIQFPRINNLSEIEKRFDQEKINLIFLANNEVASGLVKRGGGIENMTLRTLRREDGDIMAVIHVYVDTCDAMGANIITAICEFLRPYFEELFETRAGMSILSNLVDSKLVRAKVVINEIDADLAERIEEASLFAHIDPYRAATNNKGIMNAMDAILIATGNDWRAVEAGLHAYAARNGSYSSITKWYRENQQIHGELITPMSVGITGGVTQLHPTVKVCIRLLGVESAEELARVIAAVGLVQNLAAIRALVTDGIIKGHLHLHLGNMAMANGATHEQLPIIKSLLAERLKEKKYISSQDVIQIIAQIQEINNDK